MNAVLRGLLDAVLALLASGITIGSYRIYIVRNAAALGRLLSRALDHQMRKQPQQ